jgi:hypothetical protein
VTDAQTDEIADEHQGREQVVRFLWLTWNRRASIFAGFALVGSLVGFAFTIGGHWFAYQALGDVVGDLSKRVDDQDAKNTAQDQALSLQAQQIAQQASSLAGVQAAQEAIQNLVNSSITDLSSKVGVLAGKIDVLISLRTGYPAGPSFPPESVPPPR